MLGHSCSHTWVSLPTQPHGIAHLGSAKWSFWEREHKGVHGGCSWKQCKMRPQTPSHCNCMNKTVCCASCMFPGVAETVAAAWTNHVSSPLKFYTGYPCNLLYTWRHHSVQMCTYYEWGYIFAELEPLLNAGLFLFLKKYFSNKYLHISLLFKNPFFSVENCGCF